LALSLAVSIDDRDEIERRGEELPEEPRDYGGRGQPFADAVKGRLRLGPTQVLAATAPRRRSSDRA
jgi:hypothetical protein